MIPEKRRSSVAGTAVLLALLALGAPPVDAHGGGGGGHGGGGGSHSGGAQYGNVVGNHYQSYPNYHGYPMGSNFGRTNLSTPAQPVWEGFPDDLPFNRLQRFLAIHLPHLHKLVHPVG